jgi:Coilin N-terminus
MTNRVQIDLSEFFTSTDVRRKVYVRLGDFEKISHLQKHVISLFKLPATAIYLKSTDGILFPKQEAISIIQPGDVLM